MTARSGISGCHGLRCSLPALSAAAFALLANNAFAADLSAKGSVKAQLPALGYDWTGFYIGGHIGLAARQSNWTLDPLVGRVPISGLFGLFRSPNAFTEGGSWARRRASRL
jgi:high affinity Mn2+ porin